MGGGVILIDYDRDGWPDIFFTNNSSVEQQLKNETVAGALYSQQSRWDVQERHGKIRAERRVLWDGRRGRRIQQ